MSFSYSPNIYTGDLPRAAVMAAIGHAKDAFPLESCGAVIGGEYVPFRNVSDEPHRHFMIDDQRWFAAYMAGRVDCLVHSHNDCNVAEVPDQVQQQELGVPSMVINLRERELLDCILFGGEPLVPLEGRPFFYGFFDCFSLVRDFVWQELAVLLPNPPRPWEFWARGEDFVERILLNDTAVQSVAVPDGERLQKGDIIFYNYGGTRYINHVGVACGGGQVLHHFYNTVSGRYPLEYARKYQVTVRRLG